MNVTPYEIRPSRVQNYRHRQGGWLATVQKFVRRPGGERYGMARLVSEDGRVWVGSIADFWQEWIHADAYNETLN